MPSTLPLLLFESPRGTMHYTCQCDTVDNGLRNVTVDSILRYSPDA